MKPRRFGGQGFGGTPAETNLGGATRMVTTTYDQIGRGYPLTRRPDPRIAHQIAAALGDSVFLGAFWRRPHAYLDPRVRSGMSAYAAMSAEDRDEGLGRLAADVASGAWHDRHREILARVELDLGYRLLVAGPPAVRG